MTKPEVLRTIAQALDEGAPEPISLVMYQTPMTMLLHTQGEWAAWASVFDLSPIDAAYSDKYMPPGKTNVSLASDGIVLAFHLTAGA
jgi:hypothetical protein